MLITQGCRIYFTKFILHLRHYLKPTGGAADDDFGRCDTYSRFIHNTTLQSQIDFFYLINQVDLYKWIYPQSNYLNPHNERND